MQKHDLTIDFMKAAHAEQIVLLVIEAFKPTEDAVAEFRARARRILQESENCVLVASDENETVKGVSVFSYWEINKTPGAWLKWLAVSADARQQGIGRSLLQQTEAHIKQDMFHGQSGRLYLDAPPARYQAAGFYQKQGYQDLPVNKHSSAFLYKPL